jgi:hypothetical protein
LPQSQARGATWVELGVLDRPVAVDANSAPATVEDPIEASQEIARRRRSSYQSARERNAPAASPAKDRAHEPATDAGWAAWDTLLRCAGQLRIAPSGWIVGLDLAAAIAVGTALGHRDGTSGGRSAGRIFGDGVAANQRCLCCKGRIKDRLTGRAPAQLGYLGESAILH